MSREAVVPAPWSPFEQLRLGRQVILAESQGLVRAADRLGGSFCRAVELVYGCSENVIVSGMGKAGQVGQKIVATLASTGTRSHYLHPSEALHGDLGRIHPHDVVLVLSQSGQTEEVLRLLPPLAELGVAIIAMTGRADSTLGRAATVTLELGPLEEACPLGLAPTTSTTVMLAVGDALAIVVSRLRGFGRDDFARFHPAGNLGFKLSKVEHHMRPLDQCRVALESKSVREVFVHLSVPGRRTGAIMLTNEPGKPPGLFTDSDLARLFERRRDPEFDQPIGQVMTANPLTVPLGSRMTEAVALMAQRKISELPVIDAQGRPAGLIDVTDVVALLPKDAELAAVRPAAADRPACRVVYEPGE